MTRLPHLLAADLKRHRWVLLLWLLVTAGSALAMALMPFAATEPHAASRAGFAYFLLSCTYLTLFVFIVPLVVQSDPAVGSDAFWMTRPIPPRVLFLEKCALLVGALVFLPVAIDLALMSVYEVPPRDALAVAAQGIAFKSLWVAGLIALAILSASVARFAVLFGAALATAVGLIAITTVMSLSHLDDEPMVFQTGMSWTETAVLVLLGGLIVAGFTVALVQYSTRRRLISTTVGAFGGLLVLAVSSSLPAGSPETLANAPQWARDVSRISLTAQAGDTRISTQSSGRSERSWKLIAAPVVVRGLEPGWSAEIGVRNVTWQVNGQTAWRSARAIGYQPTLFEADDAAVSAATRQALGVSRVIETRAPWQQAPRATLAVMDSGTFSRLPAVTGSYAAAVLVSLTRFEVEGSLPIRQGAQYRKGAHRVAITRVYRGPEDVTVLLRVSNANSIFVDEPRGERTYFLRNLSAGEAVAVSLESADVSGLSFLPWGGFSSGDEGNSAGFSIESWLVRGGTLTGPDGHVWKLTDQWLEKAELVILDARRDGSVQRVLSVENFPMRTAPSATP